jgi:hypothetical protein
MNTFENEVAIITGARKGRHSWVGISHSLAALTTGVMLTHIGMSITAILSLVPADARGSRSRASDERLQRPLTVEAVFLQQLDDRRAVTTEGVPHRTAPCIDGFVSLRAGRTPHDVLRIHCTPVEGKRASGPGPLPLREPL